MKDIVKRYYDLFIKSSKKIYEKNNIIKKLTMNPDFIPRSAKSNFKLGVSDKVKLSNEYNDLAQAAEQVKTAFEKKQKQHIRQVATLEVNSMVKERQGHFIEGLFEITSMIYLWKTNNDEIIEQDIHHIVQDIIKRDDSLLLYTFNAKHNEFITSYTTVYPLSTEIMNESANNNNNNNNGLSADIDIPPHALQATLDHYFPANNQQQNQQLLNTQDTHTVTTAASTQASLKDDDDFIEEIMQYHPLNESDLVKLIRILKDVYVHSWSTEQKNIENKLLEAKMTKFTKLKLLTKATDEAAEIVANEPAASMAQLEEIINKKVEEKTKQITKDFQRKIQQITRNNTSDNEAPAAKNSKRRERNNRANKNKSKTTRARSSSSNSNRSANNQRNNRPQSTSQSNKQTSQNRGTSRERSRKNKSERQSTTQRQQTTTRNNQQRNQQRESTPRRKNRNRNQGKADESPQDTRARNGVNNRGRNRSRSKSNSRNTRTGSKRQRNRQN
jgi:hypothetical protein